MKKLWSEPEVTEIKIKMTEDNKIGNQPDMYSSSTPLCGEIIPTPPCCS